MMQGCHPPPPHGIPPCLVKWVVVLFGLVAFPVVGPAPPVGGSVFYRGMVWLLPLVRSNVIVTCLVPSPPCGVLHRYGSPLV